MTQKVADIFELHERLHEVHASRRNIGFVPTMGALHQGHLELVRHAKRANDLVVVSIFVNERQFNNPEDYTKYPRKPYQDLELLSIEEVDIVYFPNADELFTQVFTPPTFHFNGLDTCLEGASRPGHFQGVVDVVYALFQHVDPTMAYFGMKDFQQVAIIRKMIADFALSVELIEVPTIRSEQGLALSSRNLRLNEAEKTEALVLVNTLTFIEKNYGILETTELLERARDQIRNSSLKLDYLEIVDKQSLKPLSTLQTEAVACVAAYCGSVRLIDNMLLIAR